MSALTLHRSEPANAFAELEARLRALDSSGDRIAAATRSLRAAAMTFAAASARLQTVGRPRLRIVR